MKTYSDLQATDYGLQVVIELEAVGSPDIEISAGKNFYRCKLYKTTIYDFSLPLLHPFEIKIQLKNKDYFADHETAVKIKTLQIDGIDLVPRFDYMATYVNDHNNTDPTSYLGFNGQWTLTFDRPFYQWLHQATAQGWLIS
jgi:hypothetical protein